MRGPKLPTALTKAILTKFILSLVFLAVFILIAVFFSDRLYIGLLPGAFALFICMDATTTLYNCKMDNYVVISGECTEVELTRFKRKIKSVWISSNRGPVMVILRYKVKEIEVGDTVSVYAPISASIYEKGQSFILNEYYAVSIAKKSS